MRRKITMLFAALLCIGAAWAQTLPAANKSYTVVAEGHNSGAKPGWAINNEATKMVSFGNTDIANEAQKEFAFVQHENKVYLYSVWAKKFVNKDMNLTDALPIDDIKVENVEGGKYYFKYDDSHNMNIGGSKQLAPDGWNTKDGGNQYTLTIVKEELDLTEALKILNNSVVITYEFVYEGKVRYTQKTEVAPGAAYPDCNISLPFGVTAAAKPEGQVSEAETIQIALNVALPFAYAESYEAIEANQSWYYLMFHATQKNYLYYDGTENVLDASKTSVETNNKDAYSWAFVGNPFDGFNVVNRLAGTSKQLNASANGAVVGTAAHTFQLTSSAHGTNGFFMASSNGENTQRFNKQGGKVVYWSGADAGSTFMVEIRPMGAVAELEALIEVANELLGKVNGNIGTQIGEYAQATANTLSAAITTARGKGNSATAEDVNTLQAAIDAVSVILPTVGQYYQIHSALAAFPETKAAYSNGEEPGWKTLNNDDESFYWLAVETANGGVAFQNVKDGKYLQGHEHNVAWTMEDESTNANISVVVFSKDQNVKGFEYGLIIGGFQMHAMNHGGGSGSASHFVGYNTNNANSASSWYIVKAELPQFCEVVYNFVFDDVVKYTTTISVAKDAAYPEVVVPALPYGVTVNATKPEGTVNENKVVNFELTVEKALPFKTAADVNSIDTWYYLQMHTNQPGYIGDIEEDGSINVAKDKESDGSDNYVWGFAGNVFDGIVVVNKGTRMQLTSTGSGNVAVAADGTAFFVAATTETSENATYGFCLRNKNSKQYMNANYGVGKLSHWESTDAGSTFFATECDKEYAVEVSAVGYSTYYSLYRLIIPETVKAYVVAETNEGAAVLQQVTGVLPARTGVILEGEGTHTFVTIDAPAAAIESNKLQGSIVAKEVTVAENKAAYILGNGTKGVGLYKAMLTDGKFTNNANKAYMILDVEAAAGAAMFSFGRGEGTTGIDNSQLTIDNVVIYDILGRRVETMEKGIYIVNGKKVIR